LEKITPLRINQFNDFQETRNSEGFFWFSGFLIEPPDRFKTGVMKRMRRIHILFNQELMNSGTNNK